MHERSIVGKLAFDEAHHQRDLALARQRARARSRW